MNNDKLQELKRLAETARTSCFPSDMANFRGHTGPAAVLELIAIAERATPAAASAGAAGTIDTVEIQLLAMDWASKYHSPFNANRNEAPAAWDLMVKQFRATVAEAVKAHEVHLMQSYAPLMDAVSAQCRIEKAEAKLRAATAPVSAAPMAGDAADDHQQAVSDLRKAAFERDMDAIFPAQIRVFDAFRRATLPQSAGAPASAAQARAQESYFSAAAQSSDAPHCFNASAPVNHGVWPATLPKVEQEKLLDEVEISLAGAPVSAAEAAPSHETIVRQDGELVCTACGTTATPSCMDDQPGWVCPPAWQANPPQASPLPTTYRLAVGWGCARMEPDPAGEWVKRADLAMGVKGGA